MSELRLDLMVNGKKKTFIQDRVPLRKAIEYTEKQKRQLHSLNESVFFCFIYFLKHIANYINII